jgi:predicted  nucleic acid-binding Zn-ribbon protein
MDGRSNPQGVDDHGAGASPDRVKGWCPIHGLVGVLVSDNGLKCPDCGQFISRYLGAEPGDNRAALGPSLGDTFCRLEWLEEVRATREALDQLPEPNRNLVECRTAMAWIVAYEDAAMVAPLDELRERKEQIQERARSLLGSRTIYADLRTLEADRLGRVKTIEDLDQEIAGRKRTIEELNREVARGNAQLREIKVALAEVERDSGMPRPQTLGWLKKLSIVQREIQLAEEARNRLNGQCEELAWVRDEWRKEITGLQAEDARLRAAINCAPAELSLRYTSRELWTAAYEAEKREFKERMLGLLQRPYRPLKAVAALPGRSGPSPAPWAALPDSLHASGTRPEAGGRPTPPAQATSSATAPAPSSAPPPTQGGSGPTSGVPSEPKPGAGTVGGPAGSSIEGTIEQPQRAVQAVSPAPIVPRPGPAKGRAGPPTRHRGRRHPVRRQSHAARVRRATARHRRRR